MAEENNQENQKKGFFSSMPKDGMAKTLIVTVSLCFVCSIIVSGAAVILKDKQAANALNDKRANILEVAGLDDKSVPIDARFEQIEARLVDLSTGDYVEQVNDLNADDYDQRKASRIETQSIQLEKSDDIAGIKRRAEVAKIYLVKDDSGNVTKYVLPFHGYGLWSTMYGFVSLESDGNTVYRIKYYEQGETAGLGGEVENPNWRKQWQGKKLLGDGGDYALNVAKPGAGSGENHIDGLAGATLTTRGIDNMFKFWMTNLGFGPYLEKVRQN